MACSIWVYVTSPGVPSRTILAETPNEYLLPPRSSLVRENQIPADQTVKVHTVALDAGKIIRAGGAMAASGVYRFDVRMSETSDAWGTHTETATISVNFDPCDCLCD